MSHIDSKNILYWIYLKIKINEPYQINGTSGEVDLYPLVNFNSNTLSTACPPTPLNITITPSYSTNMTVKLSWIGSNTVTSYSIYRTVWQYNMSATNIDPIATGLNTTTYIDTGLSNGTYHYFVVASNGAGDSGASNRVSVTVAIPPKPAIISGYSIFVLLGVFALGIVFLNRNVRSKLPH